MKLTLANSIKRARRLRARLKALNGPHGITLMYHRVAEPLSDPWGLAVTPQNFAQHIDILADYGTCMRFDDFSTALRMKDRPQRMIAVTFDDGYLDNLENAEPLLEARQVPATVFAVSSAVGAERDFWWDALARLFLETRELPQELSFSCGGGLCHWRLSNGGSCSDAELAANALWHAPSQRASNSRQVIFHQVWRMLIRLPLSEAEHLCQEIVSWGGLERSGPRRDHPMSRDDLGLMSRSGLIEIGGHTVTHPALDTLSAARAAAEIGECREALGEMAGHEITTFAYPFGRFAADTSDLVRDAGFKAACTTRENIANRTDDPFLIPRVQIGNWSGAELAGILRQICGP